MRSLIDVWPEFAEDVDFYAVNIDPFPVCQSTMHVFADPLVIERHVQRNRFEMFDAKHEVSPKI